MLTLTIRQGHQMTWIAYDGSAPLAELLDRAGQLYLLLASKILRSITSRA